MPRQPVLSKNLSEICLKNLSRNLFYVDRFSRSKNRSEQYLSFSFFLDATKLSILYLDHNNLTTIHEEWFENFHTRWTNSNRKQFGQIFLDPNPWVCDCSSIDFHNFQIKNPFFHDKYDKDEGWAQQFVCKKKQADGQVLFQPQAVN